MTLPQIHQLLDLFKEYLKYSIPKYEMTASYRMNMFKKTGNIFYWYESYLGFDEWLTQNGYEELSLTPNECYEKTD
jgi:hypothetical protein